MIRPELAQRLRPWTETLSALALVAFGLWVLSLGGWLFRPLGGLIAAIAAIWALDARRRMRFHSRATAPGVVELDEGAIRYLSPDRVLGGEIALRELSEIRLLRLNGQRHWRLKSLDGQALLIPVDAPGADALASAFASLPGLDLGACMIPARSVGGDFYDVLVLDDDQIGLVIGDVSGKGVPAALFMALTCSLLRAESRRGTTPEAALQAVNRQLLTYPTHSMFVTVLYGILRRSTGEFAYVRAGHELPLLLAADGADCSPQRRPGQPLGLFDNCLLDIQSLVLPAGGTLLLYTDGLNEAMTAEYEQFGREGVLATACAALDTSAQALCDQLVAAANAHSAGMPQHDDITLLALRARH